MAMIRMLYPEERPIDEDRVVGWAHDALVNAAVDDYVRANGPIPDGSDGDQVYQQLCTSVPTPSLVEAMDALSDLGLCTFARCQPDL